jgi:hypothetical protein
MHNEELHGLYFSPNIIQVIASRISWTGHVARTGDRSGAHTILVGKYGGKRPLGRPIHVQEDNIKTDFQEIGWRAWTGLMWLRVGTAGGLLWTR